ncbi:MAG: amidohydrolase family protein [Boseongicola sp. SB0664_bin_43]|uniref:Amidohydrolase family protein n=1 Tax=Boseongicola sp. SB0664_bin_43 TaxID=2604844 RepID=A0A6B0Y053_9RHOB|nr:amidohydrolase family protein [Boseongicola sp. SB0664_bin_43]MYK32055.1 amidohydrolase family protein [Boseongicola sp. SB0670_bin_30]
MTRIDAHQHFWSLARGDYGWLTPELASIYRDFLPDDLRPLLAEAGIDGTILVQAAPTVAETEFMLGLAREEPFIRGVVGWLDFEDPRAPDEIARLARQSALVGLRPMIQDIADDGWMLGEGLVPAFDTLVASDLTFDALTLPRHLPALRELLARHPEMRTVIDHGSKPLIRDGIMDGWDRDMAALASETSAFCKLSGLVTEALADWTVDDLRPYVDHLLDTFGPYRLVWGSDWPVCTLASSYERWVEVTGELLSGLVEDERSAILGGNAARAYRLRAPDTANAK